MEAPGCPWKAGGGPRLTLVGADGMQDGRPGLDRILHRSPPRGPARTPATPARPPRLVTPPARGSPDRRRRPRTSRTAVYTRRDVRKPIGDPDTFKVALREAREESGLEVRSLDEAIFDLDVHLIPARGCEPAHYHYDVRFLVQTLEDRFRVSEESWALAWVPADRVGVFTNHESVLRMERKWQARRDGRELLEHAAANRPERGPGARGNTETTNEAG